MNRPTMLPQTGELKAFGERAEAQQAAFRQHATSPVEDLSRSGYAAYFTYAGARYSLSTLCVCADVAIMLSADGTPRDYVNATYTCPVHGAHQVTAIRCYETPAHRTTAAFAWVEQRHARDRRIAWGMAPRRTP